MYISHIVYWSFWIKFHVISNKIIIFKLLLFDLLLIYLKEIKYIEYMKEVNVEKVAVKAYDNVIQTYLIDIWIYLGVFTTGVVNIRRRRHIACFVITNFVQNFVLLVFAPCETPPPCSDLSILISTCSTGAILTLLHARISLIAREKPGL